MTTASDEAAAALRASMSMNREQQALTDESCRLLTSLLRDEMRHAVADGISAAMTEDAAERFWAKGLEVLQRQTRQKAGGFLLDGLVAAGKRLLWVAAFVVVVYGLGGWALVKAMWVAMTAKG